jgi:hypothetical protein
MTSEMENTNTNNNNHNNFKNKSNKHICTSRTIVTFTSNTHLLPNMSNNIVNIKPRVSAYKVSHRDHHDHHNKNTTATRENWNDASPAMQDDDHDKNDKNYDDDDNDKGSKIQRTSRQFLWKSIVGLIFFFFGAISIQSYLEQQQQQQQQPLHIKRPPKISSSSSSSSSSSFLSSAPNVENVHAPDSLKAFQEQDTKLAQLVNQLDQQVRARKAMQGVIMETDVIGLPLTQKLQQATLQLLQHRYGSTGPFRIRIDVTYPPSIILNEGQKSHDYLLVETAPTSLLPCSVFYFLEIARTYQSGSFHRNAGHVLQAQVSSRATAHHQSMPFQEYHPQFPHVKYTVGYAGRPSGPGWYVSIQDNTHSHGPGSQQKDNPHEADSLFGKLVNEDNDDNDSDNNDEDEDENDDENNDDENENENDPNDHDEKNNQPSLSQHDFTQVVTTIHSVPQKEWLDPPNHIAITKMTIYHQQQIDNDDNSNDDNNDNHQYRWVPLTFPSDDLLLVMQH